MGGVAHWSEDPTLALLLALVAHQHSPQLLFANAGLVVHVIRRSESFTPKGALCGLGVGGPGPATAHVH